MANKAAAVVTYNILGDGVSSTLVVDLRARPIQGTAEGGAAKPSFMRFLSTDASPSFASAAVTAGIPTAPVVVSTTVTNFVVTVTFASPLPVFIPNPAAQNTGEYQVAILLGWDV
jgi:hypothetical protein